MVNAKSAKANIIFLFIPDPPPEPPDFPEDLFLFPVLIISSAHLACKSTLIAFTGFFVKTDKNNITQTGLVPQRAQCFPRRNPRRAPSRKPAGAGAY